MLSQPIYFLDPFSLQGAVWDSVHIDHLLPQQLRMPSLATLNKMSVSNLFGESIRQSLVANVTVRVETDMEVDPDPANLPSEPPAGGQNIDSGNAAVWPGRQPRAGDAPDKSLDLVQLLVACVHGVTALLESKGDVNHSTERIHKLLRLLKETHNPGEFASLGRCEV